MHIIKTSIIISRRRFSFGTILAAAAMSQQATLLAAQEEVLASYPHGVDQNVLDRVQALIDYDPREKGSLQAWLEITEILVQEGLAREEKAVAEDMIFDYNNRGAWVETPTTRPTRARQSHQHGGMPDRPSSGTTI